MITMTKKRSNILNKDFLYMGIDFGEKKIGFAIGQLITAKTSPISIVKNIKNQVNWEEINNIIENWKPNVIIVGYPHTNEKGPFIKKLDIFIEELSKRYLNSINVLVFSEVLSTEESKAVYSDMRKSNYKISKKEDLDDLAASIILQSWFNENMIS